MSFSDLFYVAGAVIASLGGGALLLAAFSSWLGSLWAKQMLQNERAKHAEKLESIKASLDLLKQKDFTRHNERLTIYRNVINMLSETIQDFEAVALGHKKTVNPETISRFAESRVKSYGYIALISNQDVMDRFNELIDYLLPIVYQNQTGSWV